MYNVYPMYVSTRSFDVTYLNTENYMHFSNIHIKKKKKKKDRPTDPPNFQGKRAKKPLFFLFLTALRYFENTLKEYGTYINSLHFQFKTRLAANIYLLKFLGQDDTGIGLEVKLDPTDYVMTTFTCTVRELLQHIITTNNKESMW